MECLWNALTLTSTEVGTRRSMVGGQMAFGGHGVDNNSHNKMKSRCVTSDG
ncbi:unnamed protein product [Anisakis simplex]|uniref:Uncharacterized protein n=1 Tax=Anisakis simplex TaxID=6269 RepID=A0A0M3KD92_ANISI|nr:unnamed protein product [Anisakis simplex]